MTLRLCRCAPRYRLAHRMQRLHSQLHDQKWNSTHRYCGRHHGLNMPPVRSLLTCAVSFEDEISGISASLSRGLAILHVAEASLRAANFDLHSPRHAGPRIQKPGLHWLYTLYCVRLPIANFYHSVFRSTRRAPLPKDGICPQPSRVTTLITVHHSKVRYVKVGGLIDSVEWLKLPLGARAVHTTGVLGLRPEAPPFFRTASECFDDIVYGCDRDLLAQVIASSTPWGHCVFLLTCQHLASACCLRARCGHPSCSLAARSDHDLALRQIVFARICRSGTRGAHVRRRSDGQIS